MYMDTVHKVEQDHVKMDVCGLHYTEIKSHLTYCS